MDALGGEFRVQRKSNAPVFIGVAVVVIGALVGGFFLLNSGEDPKPKEQAVVEDEEPKEDPRKKEGEKRLAEAIKFGQENPDEYDLVKQRFNQVASQYKKFPKIHAKAQAEANKAHELGREMARQAWQDIRSTVQSQYESGEFVKAMALFEEVPKIMSDFLTHETAQEYRELFAEVKINARAMSHLQELKVKAVRYAQDDYPEIAKQILRFFPEKYEGDAHLVWKIKEDTLRDIEQMQIGDWLEREQKEEAVAEARKAERRRRAEQKRREVWAERLQSNPWATQLGRDNLYNWVISSDAHFGVDSGQVPASWRLQVREGEAVLSVNNTTGGEAFNGIFNSFWSDYVLQFDVRILSGGVSISPRTSAQVPRGGLPQPNRSGLIDIDDESYPKGRWVTITMEVQGERIEVTRSDKPADKKVYTEDDLLLLEEGGFLFVVADKSNVELRKIRTKLITHTRERLF